MKSSLVEDVLYDASVRWRSFIIAVGATTLGSIGSERADVSNPIHLSAVKIFGGHGLTTGASAESVA